MSLRELKEAFAAGRIPKAEYIDRMHERHRVLHEYAALLRSTDIASIEVTDGEVQVTTRRDGLRLVCAEADKRIVPVEILNFGAFEPAEAELVLAVVADGATVLDVGANIGWYSLLLSKRRPGCRIHAFEPIPETFALLERHIALNSARNAVPHNFALGSERTETVFYFDPAGSGAASAANITGSAAAREVRCQVRRLDDFVAGEGLTVDFIKCDVEGAELHVFRGGLETLRRDRPAVFTEMLRKWAAKFGYHPNEIIDLFAGLGYRCFRISGAGLAPLERMDDATLETNFFLLHGEKHRRLIEGLLK